MRSNVAEDKNEHLKLKDSLWPRHKCGYLNNTYAQVQATDLKMLKTRCNNKDPAWAENIGKDLTVTLCTPKCLDNARRL